MTLIITILLTENCGEFDNAYTQIIVLNVVNQSMHLMGGIVNNANQMKRNNGFFSSLFRSWNDRRCGGNVCIHGAFTNNEQAEALQDLKIENKGQSETLEKYGRNGYQTYQSLESI